MIDLSTRDISSFLSTIFQLNLSDDWPVPVPSELLRFGDQVSQEEIYTMARRSLVAGQGCVDVLARNKFGVSWTGAANIWFRHEEVKVWQYQFQLHHWCRD